MKEKIYIGGLLRCCIATLDELRANPENTPHEGQIIKCKYCEDGSMIWWGDGWHWNSEGK